MAPFVFVSGMGLEHALPDWKNLAFAETNLQSIARGHLVLTAKQSAIGFFSHQRVAPGKNSQRGERIETRHPPSHQPIKQPSTQPSKQPRKPGDRDAPPPPSYAGRSSQESAGLPRPAACPASASSSTRICWAPPAATRGRARAWGSLPRPKASPASRHTMSMLAATSPAQAQSMHADIDDAWAEAATPREAELMQRNADLQTELRRSAAQSLDVVCGVPNDSSARAAKSVLDARRGMISSAGVPRQPAPRRVVERNAFLGGRRAAARVAVAFPRDSPTAT